MERKEREGVRRLLPLSTSSMSKGVVGQRVFHGRGEKRKKNGEVKGHPTLTALPSGSTSIKITTKRKKGEKREKVLLP